MKHLVTRPRHCKSPVVRDNKSPSECFPVATGALRDANSLLPQEVQAVPSCPLPWRKRQGLSPHSPSCYQGRVEELVKYPAAWYPIQAMLSVGMLAELLVNLLLSETGLSSPVAACNLSSCALASEINTTSPPVSYLTSLLKGPKHSF